MKYFLSVCAIIKNENNLEEFLTYYWLQGVEHFYIYDNDSTIFIKNRLNQYLLKKICTIIDIHGSGKQMDAYNHCLKNYGKYTEWLFIIDGDEYVVPKKHQNLKHFLNDYNNAHAIGINWVFFGTSFHDKKQDGFIIDNYRYCSKYQDKHIKSIFRPKYVKDCTNPHFVNLIDSSKYVDPTNNIIYGPFNNYDTVHIIQLNHYYSKSIEDSWEKENRGRADTGNKYTVLHDHNINNDRKDNLICDKYLTLLQKFTKIINVNWKIYKALNDDLVFLNNDEEVYKHLFSHGINENRPIQITDKYPDFSIDIYRTNYFSNNLNDLELELDYIKNGWRKRKIFSTENKEIKDNIKNFHNLLESSKSILNETTNLNEITKNISLLTNIQKINNKEDNINIQKINNNEDFYKNILAKNIFKLNENESNKIILSNNIVKLNKKDNENNILAIKFSKSNKAKEEPLLTKEVLETNKINEEPLLITEVLKIEEEHLLIIEEPLLITEVLETKEEEPLLITEVLQTNKIKEEPLLIKEVLKIEEPLLIKEPLLITEVLKIEEEHLLIIKESLLMTEVLQTNEIKEEPLLIIEEPLLITEVLQTNEEKPLLITDVLEINETKEEEEPIKTEVLKLSNNKEIIYNKLFPYMFKIKIKIPKKNETFIELLINQEIILKNEIDNKFKELKLKIENQISKLRYEDENTDENTLLTNNILELNNNEEILYDKSFPCLFKIKINIPKYNESFIEILDKEEDKFKNEIYNKQKELKIKIEHEISILKNSIFMK